MAVKDTYLNRNDHSIIYFCRIDPPAGANITDIVPSRSAIAREITRQANEIRERLSVELRDAANNGCLSISPDLWSDKFKQNSYLGLTAHYVDDDHALHSVILCCEPYNEIDKRANSVRKVRNDI